MFFRIFTTISFLLISCLVNAREYPDHLLNRSFAVQFYGVDSLYKKISSDDSAKFFLEIEQLKKWAGDNGDLNLKNALAIKEYYYSYRAKTRENVKVETGMPSLIKELHNNKMPELEAQALDLLAEYYWEDPRKYAQGFECTLGAYNIYEHFSPENFPPKYNFIYNTGLAYYRFRDYPNAIKLFKEAQNTQSRNKDQSNYSLLNTIGLCFRHSGIYDSAEYYFLEANKFAKQDNKTVWIGITNGNLGITYYLEKRYTEAIPLLEYDIQTSLEHNKLSENAAKSIAILGDVFLQLNDKTKGLALLLQANQMINDGKKWSNYDLLESVYSRLAKAYAVNGNYQLAYNFSDSARRVFDSTVAQKNALILSGVQEKINIEKHATDVQQHDRELKIQMLVWVFLLVSITLLSIAIFFVHRNYNNQKKTNLLISREKKRSEDLLLNILPSEVADELKDKGTAEAKYFDHVTVMFTDFVNFTQASERMNPQQLIDELHTCFKAFDEIISKYNIEKIKTIGDAYLAVSGLPVADPLHAEHILSAALDILKFMRQRQQQMGDKTFHIRIGIHTGSVVAGIVGVIKFAYDIWGDTVNIAARMEQNSEVNKINISEPTYKLVKDKFVCKYRGKIEAKNKGEIDMYFVEGVNTPAAVNLT